jgi:LytS/YehU family sensor histidine kinase
MYVGIFMLVGLATLGVVKFRQLKQKARRQQLVEYQLRALKNQIDPHFTFNIINSISLVVATGDIQTAQEYLDKLAKLLRAVLDHSDRAFVSVDAALETVRVYLDLEKIRFKEKLEWRIEVDPKADVSVFIPRMMLQQFVDNALRHGLRHKEGTGRIDVRVFKQGADLCVEICDNGIGRAEAKKLNTGNTGNGTVIMQEMLKAYNDLYETKIEVKIRDLGSRQKPEGTCVKITING